MATQNQKPSGLPNPYAQGALPNPYALAAADGAAAVAGSPADEQAKLEEKKSTAKLFHQPHLIRRPQAKASAPVKKPAPAPALASAPAPRPQTSTAAAMEPRAAAEPRVTPEQRSLDYYKSTADDDAAILEARAEAQREEKARKKEERKFKKMFGNWNPHQEYKLRYPTNLGAYSAIGAYQEKVDDFIGLIRISKRQAARAKNESPPRRRQSPPPESKSPDATANPLFAPPSFDEPAAPPPMPQASSKPVAETADEAYQRRLRLLEQRDAQAPEAVPENAAETAQKDVGPPPSKPKATFFAPPPSCGGESLVPIANTPPEASAPEKTNKPRIDIAEQIRKAKELAAAAAANRPPPPPPPPAVADSKPKEPTPPPPPAPAYSATISAPPVHYSATISAPPVHYARPAPEEKDESEVQERPAKKQKTKEPKKPSKAELMMAKMGYVKGKGLGKNSDGVTTHLEVKARKEQGVRQAFDEFGESSSGNIKSAQVFDITGGLRAQGTDHGPFGEPSRVVVAWGCIDGVDLALDAERDDGGIRQEMGDMFNKKFGNILRIHVDVLSPSRPVYIQFQDPLCALNAVNRFHEGYEFQGRRVKAQFYDEVKFNNFMYEH